MKFDTSVCGIHFLRYHSMFSKFLSPLMSNKKKKREIKRELRKLKSLKKDNILKL